MNRDGVSHMEPLNPFDLPAVAKFTAAWFKVHLEGVDVQDGTNYAELIYGTGKDALCGGGYGSTKECTVTPRRRV